MGYDDYKLATPDETSFEHECENCGDGCSEVYEIEIMLPPYRGGDETRMVCLECYEKINHIK
jgi:hypothetical protein